MALVSTPGLGRFVRGFGFFIRFRNLSPEGTLSRKLSKLPEEEDLLAFCSPLQLLDLELDDSEFL